MRLTSARETENADVRCTFQGPLSLPPFRGCPTLSEHLWGTFGYPRRGRLVALDGVLLTLSEKVCFRRPVVWDALPTRPPSTRSGDRNWSQRSSRSRRFECHVIGRAMKRARVERKKEGKDSGEEEWDGNRKRKLHQGVSTEWGRDWGEILHFSESRNYCAGITLVLSD